MNGRLRFNFVTLIWWRICSTPPQLATTPFLFVGSGSGGSEVKWEAEEYNKYLSPDSPSHLSPHTFCNNKISLRSWLLITINHNQVINGRKSFYKNFSSLSSLTFTVNLRCWEVRCRCKLYVLIQQGKVIVTLEKAGSDRTELYRADLSCRRRWKLVFVSVKFCSSSESAVKISVIVMLRQYLAYYKLTRKGWREKVTSHLMRYLLFCWIRD